MVQCSSATTKRASIQKAAWLGFSVVVKGQALVSGLVADSREASRQRIEGNRKEFVCRRMVQRRQGGKSAACRPGKVPGGLRHACCWVGGLRARPAAQAA